MSDTTEQQLLHLVFGGELDELDSTRFIDLKALDIVGVFPNYALLTEPGRPRPRARSITRTCAISSCTLHRLLEPAG